MKRTFRLFAVVLTSVIAAFAVACTSGGEKSGDGKITLSTESLEFDAEGGTQTVDITGKNWQATAPDAQWIQIEPSEGMITVTLAANDTDEEKSGSIIVKNADDTKTISVIQQPQGREEPASTLELMPSEDIEFEAEGGSVTIAVSTNQSVWKAESDKEWCVVNEATGEFTITAAANSSDLDMPEAIVTVAAGEGENAVVRTVKVNQKGIPVPVRQFTMANLYYFEVRSEPEAGYYQLQLPIDIEMGVTEIMTVAFYADVVEEKELHTIFPKGTFTINPESVPAKYNINPGTGTPTTPMNGSYLMHLEMGMPVFALLMKSGTMTISGEGNNIYVDMNFRAQDSITGEEQAFRGAYKYEGAEGEFKPLFTFIQAADEEYNTVFTKVKSADISPTGFGPDRVRVTLTDDTELKEVQFVAYLTEGATRPADGTYTFAAEGTMENMTLIPGMYSPQSGLENTFYQESDGEIISVAIPATEGSMTIASEDDNYTIEFMFKGRNERNVRKRASLTGSYSGPITF